LQLACRFFTLRDDIRQPGTSREWNARIDQLKHDLIKTEADWAEILPIQRAKAEISEGRE
jgi:hypothetical protein